MKRITLLLAVFFVLFIVKVALAKEVPMESVYGEGLYNVPTGIRLSFQSETGKSWPDVSKEDRREFILNWLESNKKVVRDEEEYKKQLADEKKKKDEIRVQRKKKEKARAKVAADKLHLAQSERAARDKQIADMKAKRQKTLQRLKQIQSTRNRQRRK